MVLRSSRRLVIASVLIVLWSGCQGLPSGREGRPPFLTGDGFPVGYGLGAFDARFGLSAEEFLMVVREAKAVWEEPAGRMLFRYDPRADFRISLVFDERQRRTIEAREIRARLDSRGRSYDLLVAKHGELSSRLESRQAAYERDVRSFNDRMERLNARIAGWNERGGAPEEEFNGLLREQEVLRGEQSGLERRGEAIEVEIRAVNDLVDQINEIAGESNIEATLFNGRFVESREFEQGVYTGDGITIYQFGDTDELRIALAHELGHALGFRHVDDPVAIMHYKFGKQETGGLRLTASDLGLLKARFRAD